MCVPSLGYFGTTFRCRLHQASLPWPLCQCWGLVPAALPLWLCCEPEAPSPAAHGPELPQRGEAQSQVCRTTVHPAWPPHIPVCVSCLAPHIPVCVCAAPFTAGLSLQAPVSWSTMGRPGTSIASSAAAASSPLGHAPSSQTRRIIIVSPATRASSLLAALDAKRYMGPDSPESPALMQGALCSCLSPVTGASTPAGLFPFACVSPACVSFLQTLTKGGVTYRDEPWHKECFVCTGCKTPLAGQQFTSQDDNPYCIKCFGNLYAKKCSACTKPITGEQNSSERNTVMQ